MVGGGCPAIQGRPSLLRRHAVKLSASVVYIDNNANSVIIYPFDSVFGLYLPPHAAASHMHLSHLCLPPHPAVASPCQGVFFVYQLVQA